MGGGGQRYAGADGAPVDDSLKWMLAPQVTPEQTDQWFQPAAQPSELPTPPLPSEAYQSAPVRYLVNDVRQGILPDEAIEEIKRNPTGLRAMMAYGEGALGVGTLLAGGEGVKLPKGGRLSAGEGFAWGIKPIENIQGLPKSGIMPEGRFTTAGSEAGAFSKDELALMKQVVPHAFTETGVDVPTLYKGLGESGPVVEVKKLGASSDPVVADQERQQVRHQLDTQLGPDWVEWHRSDRRREAITDNQRNMLDRYYELEDIVGQGPAGTTASYAFVGPKPENQMPGYVEGLVRLPLRKAGLEELSPERRAALERQRAQGVTSNYDIEEAQQVGHLYRGPHFGAEDTNVLSSYRGYEETLPNGEKVFHVIEVQSDWGQARRNDLETAGMLSGEVSGAAADHPLLQHYERLGLKAAIQHAKEIGATKVILPDAETAMMTEGHDRQGGDFVNLGRTPTEKDIPQVGGMRLHYDQTLPSAMRKLTGDKGTPVDLGTHKSANLSQAQQDMLSRGEGITGGSPVFKDAEGKPKTNITGKMYDISKTPDQFKLMKAGDKFSLAKYLAA